MPLTYAVWIQLLLYNQWWIFSAPCWMSEPRLFFCWHLVGHSHPRILHPLKTSNVTQFMRQCKGMCQKQSSSRFSVIRLDSEVVLCCVYFSPQISALSATFSVVIRGVWNVGGSLRADSGKWVGVYALTLVKNVWSRIPSNLGLLAGFSCRTVPGKGLNDKPMSKSSNCESK